MSYFDYESDVLNVTELAEYLKIGLSTAYSLVKNNEIPSFRVKKSYRIMNQILLITSLIKKRGVMIENS